MVRVPLIMVPDSLVANSISIIKGKKEDLDLPNFLFCCSNNWCIYIYIFKLI